MNWDDFLVDDLPAKKAAKAYLKKSRQYVRAGFGMMVHGTNGTGKTLLATLMLKDLVAEGYSCYFITFAKMLDMYTAGWKDKEDKAWFNKKIVESQILMIDDIGKEYKARIDLGIPALDAVLRQRVMQGYVTSLTTNLTGKELNADYGASIFSLLSERSANIEINGEDQREKVMQRMKREIELDETRPIF